MFAFLFKLSLSRSCFVHFAFCPGSDKGLRQSQLTEDERQGSYGQNAGLKNHTNKQMFS